jgi:phosphoribosylamine-glycine ligase
VDGRVVATQQGCASVPALCRWLALVRGTYDAALGPGVRLVLAWDNWPNHKHERVLAAAKEQRIDLLFLPTYAPWLNPIEKLWRKMKQEVLALHRHSADFDALKLRAREFCDRYKQPGQQTVELLRYVGLARGLSG